MTSSYFVLQARKGEALVEEVGAMEEVSSSETDIKDEYDDDSPPQPPMHVKLDFDRERKRRTAIHDKMKSLIYPKTVSIKAIKCAGIANKA